MMTSIADVKCYYCGHVSGQIIGPRRASINTSSFVPREGYTKQQPRPGQRLRCERCNGPVFLEDVSPMTFGKVSPLTAVKRRKTEKPKAA